MLRIGTRGSQLARAQAEWVKERLAQVGQPAELVIIQTQGDVQADASLVKIGGKGVFVKELEAALLAGEVDLAVHSLKDLPTETPEGLTIAAVAERVDPRDVICSRDGKDLLMLPQGATLATSSLRRRAQILAVRPDLQVVEVRGNIDTRLRKLDEEQFDALAMAAAGLIRLGWPERISDYLPFDLCLPAPGQGAIAIETRTDSYEIVAALEHAPTRAAAAAERTFLASLGGGCLAPIGAVATVAGDELLLRGMVAAPDGSSILRGETVGAVSEARQVGAKLAQQLLEQGAGDILALAPPIHDTPGIAP